MTEETGSATIPSLGGFVSQVLTEICQGLADARTRLEATGAILNPKQYSESQNATDLEKDTRRRITNVDFDLMVEAHGDATSKEGIVVGVLSIGLGKQNAETQSQRLTNRVKFSVPLVLPMDTELVSKEISDREEAHRRTTQMLRG